MDKDMLREMARHQAWADGEHWKTLRANAQLLEDADIKKRLNHIASAYEMLQALARGEKVDPITARAQQRATPDEIEQAMKQATAGMASTLESVDLDRMIALPRGPKGPFEAPAGVLLLQALTHGQHHRGQNASRMRELGVTPPMTDYVLWWAIGRP
jgi:uncharacterized damage-inducible protein DinB